MIYVIINKNDVVDVDFSMVVEKFRKHIKI